MEIALLLALSGFLPQAAPPPEKHRLKDPEIAELFQEILRRRRNTYRFDFSSTCGWRDHWLVESLGNLTFEACLFARAYPEFRERFALEILENPEAIDRDILFVLLMIPRLGPDSSPALEASLLRLTRHHNDAVVDWSLERLSSLYGLSKHRALFWDHCREGRSLAFDVVSYEVNPETIRVLTELEVKERQDPRFDSKQISPQCRGALERIRILESKDWRDRIEAILVKEEPNFLLPWAESLADRRAPDLLRSLYQRELEVARRIVKPLLRESTDPTGDRDPKSFAYQFVRSPRLEGTAPDFDFSLVVYSELGGDLTLWEKRRLTHFGFLGDAEQRLLEILRPGFKFRD